MKKRLLVAIATMGLLSGVSAQCTPDMSHAGDPGIHPDSLTNFVDGYVGQAYSQTVTAVVPADTCVQIIPFPAPCSTLAFDSIVVTGVTGLPPTLTFTCAPPNCRFLGNSIDCAIITGTPVMSDTGTHNLVINLDAYVGGFGVPNSFTLTYYRINIHPPQNVNDNTPFTVGGNKPNPFSYSTQIEFSLPAAETVVFEVYNAFGQLVHSEKRNANAGFNSITFNAGGLSEGTYFYRVRTSNGTITRRMVITR